MWITHAIIQCNVNGHIYTRAIYVSVKYNFFFARLVSKSTTTINIRNDHIYRTIAFISDIEGEFNVRTIIWLPWCRIHFTPSLSIYALPWAMATANFPAVCKIFSRLKSKMQWVRMAFTYNTIIFSGTEPKTISGGEMLRLYCLHMHAIIRTVKQLKLLRVSLIASSFVWHSGHKSVNGSKFVLGKERAQYISHKIFAFEMAMSAQTIDGSFSAQF